MVAMPTKVKPGPKPPVDKLDLSGLEGSDATGKYPDLPATPKTRALVTRVIETSRDLKNAEEASDAAKAALVNTTFNFFVDNHVGMTQIPGGVRCAGLDPDTGEDKTVLTLMTARYPLLKADDEAALAALIGARTVREQFVQGFKISISGDKIPADVAPDFIADLKELLAKHKVKGAVKVESGIKPRPEFHTIRHSLLTPEVNLELQGTKGKEGLLPMTIQVKVEGVKEDKPAQ